MSEEQNINDLKQIVSDMAGWSITATHHAIIEKVLPDSPKNAESVYELADTIRKTALNRRWKAVSCEIKTTADGKIALKAELAPARLKYIPAFEHERATLDSVIAKTITSEHEVNLAGGDHISIIARDSSGDPRATQHLEEQIHEFSQEVKRTNWIMTEGYWTCFDEGNNFMLVISVVLPAEES